MQTLSPIYSWLDNPSQTALPCEERTLLQAGETDQVNTFVKIICIEML